MHEAFSFAAQVATVKNTFWGTLPPQPRSPLQRDNLRLVHKRNVEAAVNRYRAAIGDSWKTTTEIEWALCMDATTCNAFLRKLVGLGYIERRPRGNTPTYIRNRGWEFRWISGK